MDRLSPFFAHFTLSARVFYSGQLCGFSSDHATATAGHLHVLRRGVLSVLQPSGQPINIDRPSVLFYPRPCRHRFQAEETCGADIVCAFVEFGAGMLNPLVLTLPEVLIVALESVKELGPTAQLLFSEAFGERPGRQAAINCLAEYFVVLLLRMAMETLLIEGGILLGLADPQLTHAITAMHEQPERPWSLEMLAETAGMSRARFAAHFRKIVGITPFDYLATWRIGVTQSLLKKGKPLKVIAPSVGYAGSTALTRAFCQRVGMSPTEWMSQNLPCQVEP